MKQLLATSVESEVEIKGKKKTVKDHLFQIKGEEATYASEEVTLRVLAVRNKLIAWDVEGKTVTNESVLFTLDDLNDQNIPDKNGGNACGRSFASWNKGSAFDRAAEGKKAKWYTYLFGEVTFPGKKPVVVNYRLTGSQSMDWGTIEKVIKDDLASHLLKLQAVALESNDKFAKPEYSILQSGLDTVDSASVVAIEEFIQAENDKILDAYHAASPKKAATPKAQDDLSDPVPF